MQVLDRDSQAQNELRPAQIAERHRDIAQFTIESCAMANRFTDPPFIGVANFRPPCMILHTPGMMLRVRKYHTGVTDHRDSRLSARSCPERPGLQLRRRNLPHLSRENPCRRFQRLLRVL